MQPKSSILAYNYDELLELMSSLGQKPFRAAQLMDWLWKQRCDKFDQMTNLPPKMREQLEQRFDIIPLEVVEVNRSLGGTNKFLSQMRDGQLVESVIIPAAVAQNGERSGRVTLCVSSQVGCAFGCRFCASGLLGFTRNLSTAEILGQILAAESIVKARVDNLVFMGMGEPLANYDNLEQALNLIMDHRGLNIGARHITVSTSGHVEGMKRLLQFEKPIRLAISLHGATDEVRSQIMPINNKWPLDQLVPVLRDWTEKSKHMITLEYILISEVNDGLEHTRPLIQLARELRAKVNLIPYNIVDGLEWCRPSEAQCGAFAQELINARIAVTMRYEKGADIDAACGQLRLRRKTAEGSCNS